MSDVVIVLKQQGIVRASGYQVTQWFVSVPQNPGDPVTTPATYVPLFLVRNELGRESFERVATLQDLVAYPESECVYFEGRGQQGGALLAQALPGDVLTITGDALLYWEQTDAPYNNREFTVNATVNSASGFSPMILTGNLLQLPGYSFTDDDLGRWVLLDGFATTAYNTYAQILAYTGNTATISLNTTTNESGATWAFRRLQIKSDLGVPSYEPRYFPTVARNLPWLLMRGDTFLAGDGPGDGGCSTRLNPDAELVRTSRWTQVLPTQQAALDFMSSVRTQVADLQRAAAVNNTSFTAIIQTVFGP